MVGEGVRVGEPTLLNHVRRKWARRFCVVVLIYFTCWGVTWAFAPAALNRWWANHFAVSSADDAHEVEVLTDAAFTGHGLDFWPTPIPQSRWWCCVGKPRCPVPFVVGSDVVWINGRLSGFGGRVWFVWTPFGLVLVGEEREWLACGLSLSIRG